MYGCSQTAVGVVGNAVWNGCGLLILVRYLITEHIMSTALKFWKEQYSKKWDILQIPLRKFGITICSTRLSGHGRMKNLGDALLKGGFTDGTI